MDKHEFKFQSYAIAEMGLVGILKFDLTYIQDRAYTVNTTFINECIINDGIHVHDYLHLIPTSNLWKWDCWYFMYAIIICKRCYNTHTHTQTQLNSTVNTATSPNSDTNTTIKSKSWTYDTISSVISEIFGTNNWVVGGISANDTISNNFG